MKKMLKVVVLAVLLVCAVVFVSPYWTLYRIKSAYDNQEYEKMLSYVNFESVQGSLKSELTQKVNHFSSSTAGDVLAVFVGQDKFSEFGNSLVERGVEQVVTHENVLAALQGDVSYETMGFVVVLAVVLGYVDVSELMTDSLVMGMEQAIAKQTQNLSQDDIAQKYSYGYCGINCFYVETQMLNSPLRLIFHRQGVLGWQMSEVKL